jgi:hypothetical protein
MLRKNESAHLCLLVIGSANPSLLLDIRMLISVSSTGS